MKKIFLKLFLVCGLVLLICIFNSCSEKISESDDVYEHNGFYLPLKTQGYEIESASLFGKMSSSKVCYINGDDKLTDVLSLFCSKKPKYEGTMNLKEFVDYYDKNEGFRLQIEFSSSNSSSNLYYDFYITIQGVMIYGEFSKTEEYKYTEKNFGDYEAVLQFYQNWKL